MKLPRRLFLRGAGAMLALPTFECLLNAHGDAYANGTALPKRFVVWFFGNGILKEWWVPGTTGSTWALSPELSPLVNAAAGIDLKNDVTVFSGGVVKAGLAGHNQGQVGILSGGPHLETMTSTSTVSSKFSIPSVDQIAADAIGTTTKFKSLQLGVSKRVLKTEGPAQQYLSHRGPDEPLPAETNPVALFNLLFPGAAPTTTDPKTGLRVSLLDKVKEDAARLNKRLGARDRQRLDAHLTAVNELRAQLVATQSTTGPVCPTPAAVTQTNVDSNAVEPYEAVNKAMSDLMALAFACDLTRVVTFQFTGSVGGQCFPFLGPAWPFVRSSEHEISHRINDLPISTRDQMHAGITFTMKNFAATLQALKSKAEGAGNLLDNSCVLCTSDVSDGFAHSLDEFPLLIAGKAGGVLKSGQHIRKVGQNTSDVLLTCLRAVGANVASVGKDKGLSTTEVAELKA